MVAFLDGIYRGLNIPNSHGGPINGVIVSYFDLEVCVGGLDDEGEWAEFFFGAGASVIVGLSGECLIKIERVSDGYDLTWQLSGLITGDLTAGIKAGAKAYVEALGLVQIGVPVTFHFSSEYDATKGLAIALRIALSLGSKPLIEELGAAGWLVNSIIVNRTMDDILWLGRKLVGFEVKLSAKLEIGTQVGVSVAGDVVDEWNILTAGAKASTTCSTSVRARYQNGKLTIALTTQSELEGSGAAKAIGWGPALNLKFYVGTELLAQDMSKNLLSNPRYVLQWGNSKAKLSPDAIGNPHFDASMNVGVIGTGGVNITPGPTSYEMGLDVKCTLELLEILRFVVSLADSSDDFHTSLAHLDSIPNITVKLTSQEIHECFVDESIKVFGVGVSFKLGRRSGYNRLNFPWEESMNANDVVAWIASKTT